VTYAAIMTHVQADADTAPRLACAVAVAKRFGAEIHGVAAQLAPPAVFTSGYSGLDADWASALHISIDGRLKTARDLFQAATADFGDKARFESSLQAPMPVVAAACRAADLIVAGGAPLDRRDPNRDCLPGELAIKAGRPVLVAPPTAPALSAQTVLLAWKDTREARRAMADAMPFLEQASRVVVLGIDGDADPAQVQAQVDDVAGALKRRGVKAESKLALNRRPDGPAIVEQALAEGADLVVAGVYGRLRLDEWLFGGVSADLLAQDRVYLLLSH
jgi:nucleotide-binding universal stress UspA family protein